MEKRTLWGRLLAVFYPERCCCCGKVVSCGGLVCDDCRSRLIAISSPLCRFCGRQICDCHCDKHRQHTERCIAPFYYEGAAKCAALRLKFSNKPYAAELFYISMADVVRREYAAIQFDWIVPVPLSAATRKKRLYNQSALLADGLSKQLHVPWKETLVKLWDTTPQRQMPAYKRSGNVLGVFDIDGEIDLTSKSVLLVDDIATTGSTMDECAKMLKIYGAQAVYAVTATASRLSKDDI